MLPDIQKLSISNDTLPDDELNELRARRRLVRQNLDAIADNGRSAPVPSRPSRKTLQAQLNAFDLILSPHKLLPTELLSQIFVAAYPEAVYIPTQARCSPLVLCQVCSRWRSVALATPELWANVILRLAKHAQLDPLEVVQVTKAWFKRSEVTEASFISLAVLNQLPAAWEEWRVEEHFQSVLDQLVIPLAPRFRTLQLSLPSPCMRAFLSCTTTFPNLRRLSLRMQRRIGNASMGPVGTKPVAAFNRAASPRLTDFELVGFLGANMDRFDLPLAFVTRLILTNSPVSHEQSHTLLKNCRALEECEIALAWFDHHLQANATQTLIHLSPHLRSLTVEFHHSNHIVCSWFEPLVSAPSLKALSLSCPDNDSWHLNNQPLTGFLGFLSRSECAIEVLHANLTFMSPQATIAIAQALPSLIELQLPMSPLLQGRLPLALLDMIGGIGGGSPTPILPNLKVIVGHVARLPHMLQMLEKRWELANAPHRDGSGVESVFIVSCPDYVMVEHSDSITPKEASRVDSLRAKGIAIQATKSEKQATY
ncbi:hypothetical protein D9611_005545 [Ephemerocybe angulata]|uniref:F-box domain-containing protein n=1 Tax=Ephemerocybe angulata TaxID=980116 RepID=A0A8H5BI13_9AGAR|nr:hypothetical protein D9611_005545 [Tulosesus angulatus]